MSAASEVRSLLFDINTITYGKKVRLLKDVYNGMTLEVTGLEGQVTSQYKIGCLTWECKTRPGADPSYRRHKNFGCHCVINIGTPHGSAKVVDLRDLILV